MKRWPVALVCLLAGLFLGGFFGRSLLQGRDTTPPAVPKELTSYRDIVHKVLPAVVSIEARTRPVTVKGKQPRGRAPFDNQQVPEEFRRFFEDFGQAPSGAEPPQAPPRHGLGSGFVVDPAGVILTASHVVDGADRVIVSLLDGRKFETKDIKTDPKTDLAIVRVSAREPLPALELGDSSAMAIGDRVLAVGAPFGLTGTVTAGIVSSKGRSLHLNSYEDFLQTDAAINPGNSGGPLINLEGKVIGINAAIETRSGGFQGIGMAVASNLARDVMQQLIKEGVVHRAYLGVQITNIDNPDLAARLSVAKEGGVLVTEVLAKTPAAEAGLKDGDVITSLGANPVHDSRELKVAVARLPLGKPVTLHVIRDGKPQTLEVTVKEQPGDFDTAKAPSSRRLPRSENAIRVDSVGLEVSDMTPEAADRLGFRQAFGALIEKVQPDSLADQAGLERGLLITSVDRRPVKTATEFRDAVRSGSLEKGLLLQVRSPRGATSFVLLKSAAAAK
jgi:serine protease Do